MKRQSKAKTARGEISRRKILEITRRLIGASDSHSVTLDQIASACEISKSSILWYFGSKEALLLEVVDGIYHDLEQTFITQCPAGLTPYEKFDFFLGNYERLLDEHPEALMIFFSFVFNNKIREKIDKKIREIYEWNRAALCEQFGISEKKAVILLGMLNGIAIQANVHPERIHLKEIFNELMSMLKRVR